MHDDDLRFIEKRARLSRSWKPAGALAITVLAAVLAWLFASSPLLVNPVFVAARIENGMLERVTVDLMALMLPIAVLGCFVTTTIMIVFGFAVFAVERRYLAIIERLRTGGATPEGAGNKA
jgi:hypothetical protein